MGAHVPWQNVPSKLGSNVIACNEIT